jgi:DNA-binding IclR family transcriptional regulator
MPRSSPGVRRIVSILNFFAAHPRESFTLTDLVRALKLSRATCHGLLAGLVESGYLYRTSDRGYLLGPALVSIGEVAQAHYSPLKAAQPEMRILADEFDTVCSASFREGREVVVRERASAISHLGFSVPRGWRAPLLPQFAGAFFVWSAPEEVRAWLDDLNPAPSNSQRAALEKSIILIRRYGFFCAQRSGSVVDPQSSEWVFKGAYEEAPLLPIFEIDAEKSYELSWVMAPVLDTSRNTAFVIGVQGFTGQSTGARILSIGRRVCEACERITTFIGRGPPERAGAAA